MVDYDCGFKKEFFRGFTSSLFGFGVYVDIVTNFGAELKSRNAAANPTTAATASVFNTNVVTYQIYGTVRQPKPGPCTGQFFINGAEDYAMIGKAGYTETNTISNFAATVATLVIAGANALYPLVRETKPAEFDNRVNLARDILKDFADFQALFRVSSADSIDQPKDLRVGKNKVAAYDSDGNEVAWLTFNVNPVVSLVNSRSTKFLKAYQVAAASTAITLTGTDAELRQRCVDIKQTYVSSGIRDDFDIAYLLYQRLLASTASPEKTLICMGNRTIALAALDLLNRVRSPIVATRELRISQSDIDNILPVLANSEQPHPRMRLASEMEAFEDELGRHLRGRGLVGQQLAHLLNNFLPTVTIEDRTVDYKALKLMSSGQPTDTLDLTREKLLEELRKAGIIRWIGVQRTKRDFAGTSVSFYDPDIDSAVILIAAKAGANEELDFNKSTLFGVHVLFAPSNISDPLRIKKLIFEERFRDAILKDNPTWIKNTPGKS